MIIENISPVALYKESVSDELKGKFDALFPTWTTVVATILAVVILLLVIKKFVYEQIKNMVKERREYIQNNIDQSLTQNNEAAADREKANEELIQARIEASEIISQAKMDAEEVRANSVENAKNEANKIVSDAHSEMAREKVKFEQESKEAIVDVALEAARKVVEKEVDNSTNRKIVEDFIKSK